MALAIGTALLARDRGGPQLAFMMPIYPMIDDTNTLPSTHEVTDIGIWDRPGNIEAWKWYLGGKEADQYAAPARAEDVSGLPPAYIDVGTVDLFRDEDIAFAQRLMQAGVPCELHVRPGSYHASETFAPDAALSQRALVIADPTWEQYKRMSTKAASPWQLRRLGCALSLAGPEEYKSRRARIDAAWGRDATNPVNRLGRGVGQYPEVAPREASVVTL